MLLLEINKLEVKKLYYYFGGEGVRPMSNV